MVEVAKYQSINISKDQQTRLNIISCIPDRNVELEDNAKRKFTMAYLDPDHI